VEQLSSAGGSSGSGGASNVSGAAASSSGSATQPEPPDTTVARVTFCNDAQFEGMDTTFRLLVLDQVFDAYSQACSPCQDLPANTLLDFTVQKMPEAAEIGAFSSELAPGAHVISATVEEGEGVIRDNELRANQRCEDAVP
jgi:hypothetical protein